MNKTMKKIILLALVATMLAGCAEKKQKHVVTIVDTLGVVQKDTVIYCNDDYEGNCESCKGE